LFVGRGNTEASATGARRSLSSLSRQKFTATMSLPPNSPGSESPVPPRDTLLSPTSASHPLPPRPLSNLAGSVSAEQTPASTPTQSAQPRTRGGFEVDDDEDEEQEDGKDDELDVYDPAAGLNFDAPDTVDDQNPLDRQSQSPPQSNGITPVPAQAPGSPTGASSSLPQAGSGAPSAPAEIVAAAVVGAQAQPNEPFPVNGLLPAAASKSRLAHDTIGILEDRIKADPRGDSDAYLELIDEYKRRHKQDEVKASYERYLEVFPLDVSQS
jgi:cleavage stimulation factor subunit 3